MSLNVMVTQYGPSEKVGGWDGDGDSGTDAGLGCHNNKLEDGISCALSKPAEEALGVKPGVWLDILLSNDIMIERRFDDRTDPSLPNARVDLYNFKGFDNTIPDSGMVVAIKAKPVTSK